MRGGYEPSRASEEANECDVNGRTMWSGCSVNAGCRRTRVFDVGGQRSYVRLLHKIERELGNNGLSELRSADAGKNRYRGRRPVALVCTEFASGLLTSAEARCI